MTGNKWVKRKMSAAVKDLVLITEFYSFRKDKFYLSSFDIVIFTLYNE